MLSTLRRRTLVDFLGGADVCFELLQLQQVLAPRTGMSVHFGAFDIGEAAVAATSAGVAFATGGGAIAAPAAAWWRRVLSSGLWLAAVYGTPRLLICCALSTYQVLVGRDISLCHTAIHSASCA